MVPLWRLESIWGKEGRGRVPVQGARQVLRSRSGVARARVGLAVWRWAGGRAVRAEVSARLSPPGLRGGAARAPRRAGGPGGGGGSQKNMNQRRRRRLWKELGGPAAAPGTPRC